MTTFRDRDENIVTEIIILVFAAAFGIFGATVLPWLWDFLLQVKR